jgi:hypothetical protein
MEESWTSSLNSEEDQTSIVASLGLESEECQSNGLPS